MVQMQRVAARNIKLLRYCPQRMILEVRFLEDNNVYQYFDVPEEVWYNMKNVADMDMFFNLRIASNYRYTCCSRGNGKRIVINA